MGRYKYTGVSMVAAAATMIAAALCSCIDRHFPAPEVPGQILEFEVEGQAGPPIINEAMRTVTLDLTEGVDMQNVRVSRLTLTEGGSCEMAAGDVIDLTSPRTLTVRTLADYQWTVSATQSVRYEFHIEGETRGLPVAQVGESYFEMQSHSVFAHVPIDTDMSKIKILSLKLWPEGTVVSVDPEIGDGDIVNFRKTSSQDSHVRSLNVVYSYGENGRRVEQQWHLYITETDTQLDMVHPFTRRVMLVANGQNGLDNGFEYRLSEGFDPDVEEEVSGWTRVPDEMVREDGRGVFRATLTGLEKETEYVVRAFSGGSVSEVEYFTTMAEGAPLPGGGFEEWCQGPDERKADALLRNINAWNPWPAGGVWEENRWWDTGNRGVAIVNSKSGGNSFSTDEGTGSPANPEGRAAKLQTVWAMVKGAGGNIYFGEFGEMNGLDATCHLGHTWQDKPTKLKGWYQYYPVPVDDLGESIADYWKFHPYRLTRNQWLGSPDSLHVCVALWASPDGKPDTPFTVNTDPKENGKNFVDFSPDADGVIAYGAFVSAAEQDEWAEFSIDMEYYTEDMMSDVTRKYLRDYLETGRLPENTQLYLLITASKNCNYFIAGTGKNNGGAGSLMYVDEVELVYD